MNWRFQMAMQAAELGRKQTGNPELVNESVTTHQAYYPLITPPLTGGRAMADDNSSVDKMNLLYPHSRYNGQFTPQNLVFNANMQEFAQRVSYICALYTGGKISADQAYADIEQLWRQLKQSKH